MRRRRKKHDAQHENTERWLLTYADLITLLLAFFIVMYSMSNLDSKKFGKMADALNGILRGGSAVIATPASSTDMPGTGVLDVGEFTTLKREIQEKLIMDSLQDQIETIEDERGLVIRVMESAAFDPGKADIKPQMYAVLGLIVKQLKTMTNHVRVEGHTDNTPIATPRFPSNWELSTARSTGVVRYLVEQLKLNPERVSALGYAEYRPIATNETPEGRGLNRRVDIIVLADDQNKIEPHPENVMDRLARVDSLLNF
jgi:chemotaxis protein MotB